jgi:tetratricopeptide (TPR) repeat protein
MKKLDMAHEFAKTFDPELKGTVYKDLIEAYFLSMEEKNIEAIKLLEKSIRKKTSSNQRYALLNNLGNLNMAAGNRDKAREYYQMLLDEEPYEAASANNLARLLSDDRSNMPMAQQWIQKSLSLDSASSRYLDTLAKIYYLNNQPYYAAKVQKEAVLNATQFTKPRYKVHLKDYVKASQKSKDNPSSS